MKTRVTAQRRLDARADTVFHLLSDYRNHHRPGGFLPAAFPDLEVLDGGVGDGTRIRFTMVLGGRPREVEATVREPVPGRVLVEESPGLETTFTVEPEADGSRVTFETVLDEPGPSGVLTRLFAGRLVRPVYEEELDRLESAAIEHSRAEGLAATAV